MKYTKFLLFFCCLFMVASIFSCKKNPLSPDDIIKTTGVATFPNFADIVLNKAEYVKRLLSKRGYIQLSLYNPIGVKAGNPRVYATFTDSDSTQRISYGTLSVGSYSPNYDKDIKAYDSFFDYKSSDYLKSLFGTFVTFRLKDKNNVDDEALQELYVPKSINVSSPLSSAINKNATFVWDADNTNSLGIVVVVYFSTQIPGNEKLGSLQEIERTFIAKDNGSYALEAEHLTDIPSGANVVVTLARGNLVEIKGLKTGNNYLIYSSSTTAGTYKLN